MCRRILREAGSAPQATTVTGRSGDQGIHGHGTLQMNMLVSFQVLFSAQALQGIGLPIPRPYSRRYVRPRRQGSDHHHWHLHRRGGFPDGVVPIKLIDGDKLVSLLEPGTRPREGHHYEIDRPSSVSLGPESVISVPGSARVTSRRGDPCCGSSSNCPSPSSSHSLGSPFLGALRGSLATQVSEARQLPHVSRQGRPRSHRRRQVEVALLRPLQRALWATAS